MRCRGLHGLANPAYLSWFPFSALPCVAPYCVPGGIRVVSKGCRWVGSSGVGSAWTKRPRFLYAPQASRNGDGLLASGRVHTRLGNGHWYLDAVLGRGLRDPPQVWLGLTDERPRLKVHGLAYLLEEPLLQASRCLAHQPPTQ